MVANRQTFNGRRRENECSGLAQRRFKQNQVFLTEGGRCQPVWAFPFTPAGVLAKRQGGTGIGREGALKGRRSRMITGLGYQGGGSQLEVNWPARHISTPRWSIRIQKRVISLRDGI